MADEKRFNAFEALKEKFSKKPEATPAKPATPAAKPAATPAAKPAATPAAKPAATPVAKPAATPVAKPAAKPATPVAKPAAAPAAKPAPTPATPLSAKKSVEELAKEVIRGDWGNGQERKDKLAAAGYDYDTVQAKVNELLNPKPTTSATPLSAGKKSVEEIAREVIRGNWGNGQERKDRLAAAGYDYATVQAKVNELLK